MTKMNTEEIRQSFRPETVTLLLIGESPPARGKFFYEGCPMTAFTSRAFEIAHSKRFNNIKRFLEYFKACGCYLDDLCHVPVDCLPDTERDMKLRENIYPLSQRIREINPPVVVAVLKKIEDYVRDAVERSKCKPKIYSLPFPGHGHQNKYIDELVWIIDKYLSYER